MGSIIKVFRIFRITRILKLIKSVEGLKRLVNTIWFSLPSMINVSQLIFLTFYIFSILASFLYNTITFSRDGEFVQIQDNQVLGVGKYMLFENFETSFLLLFRMSTGESWQNIMFDTTRGRQHGCDFAGCEGTSNSILSFIYF
jgi:hypothetical protein